MKSIKRILMLVLIVSITISLAGCTDPDAELYKALEKMEEISSLESQTQIDFEITGEGFEGTNKKEIEEFSKLLNNLTINLKQKSLENKQQTNGQVESEIGIDLGEMVTYFNGIPINLGDLNLDIKVWADVDLEEPRLKSIIQLPSILKGLMGAEGFNKEYIVYDIGKIMKLENEDLDFKEIIESQQEFQLKMIQFSKEIQKELKPNFKILDLKEEKQVNGEKIKVYQLKLDDATLKELIKEFTHNALENDVTRDFLIDYIKLYVDNMITMGLDKEISEEEIEEIKEKVEEIEDDLEENMEKAKEEFDKFIKDFKDINILGKEGIVIEYSVNKDGYIIEINGITDIRLNLEEIARFTEQTPEIKGILNLRINYNTKNTNINSKNIKINFPDINEENSIQI